MELPSRMNTGCKLIIHQPVKLIIIINNFALKFAIVNAAMVQNTFLSPDCPDVRKQHLVKVALYTTFNIFLVLSTVNRPYNIHRPT